MTRSQEKEVERDMPAVALRNATLDAVDAYKSGKLSDPDLIEKCRDQLSWIFDDMTREQAA